MAATSEEEARERRRAASARGVARRHAKREASGSWRTCLRCEEPFLSEGAHNRLCDRCHHAVREVGVADEYL